MKGLCLQAKVVSYEHINNYLHVIRMRLKVLKNPISAGCSKRLKDKGVARIEQRSVLEYVSMQEPKRNAVYEPFSIACWRLSIQVVAPMKM